MPIADPNAGYLAWQESSGPYEFSKCGLRYTKSALGNCHSAKADSYFGWFVFACSPRMGWPRLELGHDNALAL
jgi:hypothetical protein